MGNQGSCIVQDKHPVKDDESNYHESLRPIPLGPLSNANMRTNYTVNGFGKTAESTATATVKSDFVYIT